MSDPEHNGIIRKTSFCCACRKDSTESGNGTCLQPAVSAAQLKRWAQHCCQLAYHDHILALTGLYPHKCDNCDRCEFACRPSWRICRRMPPTRMAMALQMALPEPAANLSLAWYRPSAALSLAALLGRLCFPVEFFPDRQLRQVFAALNGRSARRSVRALCV